MSGKDLVADLKKLFARLLGIMNSSEQEERKNMGGKPSLKGQESRLPEEITAGKVFVGRFDSFSDLPKVFKSDFGTYDFPGSLPENVKRYREKRKIKTCRKFSWRKMKIIKAKEAVIYCLFEFKDDALEAFLAEGPLTIIPRPLPWQSNYEV